MLTYTRALGLSVGGARERRIEHGRLRANSTNPIKSLQARAPFTKSKMRPNESVAHKHAQARSRLMRDQTRKAAEEPKWNLRVPRIANLFLVLVSSASLVVSCAVLPARRRSGEFMEKSAGGQVAQMNNEQARESHLARCREAANQSRAGKPARLFV